jgi:hypothetical protein
MVRGRRNNFSEEIKKLIYGFALAAVFRFGDARIIKERRTLLTASESGKYARTSGSSITAPSSRPKCCTSVVPSVL